MLFRATVSLGFALPLRVSLVEEKPGMISPSCRLSSTRHGSRVCETRAAYEAGEGVWERDAGVSSEKPGISGLQPRDSAGTCSPAPGYRLATIPGRSHVSGRHRSAPTSPSGWTARAARLLSPT